MLILLLLLLVRYIGVEFYTKLYYIWIWVAGADFWVIAFHVYIWKQYTVNGFCSGLILGTKTSVKIT